MSISQVQTIIVNKQQSQIITDGSNNLDTLKTINSKSLTYGVLAPGEKSNSLIIYLKVPSAPAIKNIKFGLINAGDISFNSNSFGIATSSQLDFNFIPNTYFSGVNSLKSSESIYNINVPNKTKNTSDYVYLDIKIPNNSIFGGYSTRYCWWFDFSG